MKLVFSNCHLYYFLDVFICLWKYLFKGVDPEHFYDSRGGQEIYMCLAAMFADSRINGGGKKLIKYPFMEIVYFSVHLLVNSRLQLSGPGR